MNASRSIVRGGVEDVYSDQMKRAISMGEELGLRVLGPDERACAADWRFGGILAVFGANAALGCEVGDEGELLYLIPGSSHSSAHVTWLSIEQKKTSIYRD